MTQIESTSYPNRIIENWFCHYHIVQAEGDGKEEEVNIDVLYREWIEFQLSLLIQLRVRVTRERN